MVRLSQNRHVKVREIAQALIRCHTADGLTPSRSRFLCSIEKHLPDGVRLVQTREDGPTAHQGTYTMTWLDRSAHVDHDRAQWGL